jgi:hypothetical protein
LMVEYADIAHFVALTSTNVDSTQGDRVGIRRLARLGGVKRISGLTYDESAEHREKTPQNDMTRSGGCPRCKLGPGNCRRYNQPGHLRMPEPSPATVARGSDVGADCSGSRGAATSIDDRCSQLENGVARIGDGSATLPRRSQKEPLDVRQTTGGGKPGETGPVAARARREKRSKKPFDPFEESQRPQWGAKSRETL